MARPPRTKVIAQRRLPRPKIWDSRGTGHTLLRLTTSRTEGCDRTAIAIGPKLLLAHTDGLAGRQCITPSQLRV